MHFRYPAPARIPPGGHPAAIARPAQYHAPAATTRHAARHPAIPRGRLFSLNGTVHQPDPASRGVRRACLHARTMLGPIAPPKDGPRLATVRAEEGICPRIDTNEHE